MHRTKRIAKDEAFYVGTSNEREALTFEQFKQWYTESGQDDAGSDYAPSTVSIEDIQAITTFLEYHVADAVNIISAAADDEDLLDEEAFSNCVLENFFVSTAGPEVNLAHEGHAKAVAAWLFQCFDADHSGFVDSAELVSGLTILCGGSRQDLSLVLKGKRGAWKIKKKNTNLSHALIFTKPFKETRV